jgi:hypothetical protein
MKVVGWIAWFVASTLGGTGLGAAQNVSERYLLAAANQARAEHGLSPLKIDEHLQVAARFHANQMAERGTISHQFPGEEELARRVGDAGAHVSLITENVAEASSAARTHAMWMESAGHRANLLDTRVDSVGIAVVQKDGQLYAVEDFGRTVAQLSLQQQENAVSTLLTKAGLTMTGDTATARQTCTLSTGFAGSRQPAFVMRYTTTNLDNLPAQLASRVASRKYREAAVGACVHGSQGPFTNFNIAVMLYQ